jgi:hypothetical protein
MNGTPRTAKDRQTNRQGMNWISQHKRLAIYLRDGLACSYCGWTLEQGADLTLDHVRPCIRGGTNHETNLCTSCGRCNRSKNGRTLKAFAQAVAAYVNHGLTAQAVKDHVRRCTSRSLKPHLDEAKRLVAERGSASKALSAVKHAQGDQGVAPGTQGKDT